MKTEMTVKEFAEKLNLEILTEGNLEREVTGCYSGDLLSWVMSRAKEGDAWLTVMGNVNSVAVAVLSDCACVILTEKSAFDDAAKEKALQQGITFLTSDKNAYELSVEISRLI